MGLKRSIWALLGFLAGFCHALCDPTLQPTYTSRAGIAQPQINSCSWGSIINTDWSILDSSTAFQATANTFVSTQTFQNTVIIKPNQQLQFYDSSTHFLSFQASNTVSNTNWIWPTGDGTSGQFLNTNGSGVLSFGAANGTASLLGIRQSGVLVSSPTVALNFLGPPFSLSLISGNTAQIAVDPSSVTLQGNTFNQASKLVQLDASSRLPAVDASQLVNFPSVAGSQIYPATATPSFPFGFNASTAVYSGDVNISGNTNVRAGKRLQLYGSGDVVASTITNPAASLSQIQINAANGIGINQSPVNGIDLGLPVISASSGTVTTFNTSSIKFADGTIQVSSPSAGGSGTVNSGTANQIAYYATSGASISGLSKLTYASATLDFFDAGPVLEIQDNGGANTATLQLAGPVNTLFASSGGHLKLTDASNGRILFDYVTAGGGLIKFTNVPISMENDKITNLANGTAASDAAAFGQIGTLPSLTHASITALTPSVVGQQYYCSDCATVTVCISTGTATGAWSLLTNRTSVCQ